MSKAHSVASKKRWKAIPKEERSARMSSLASLKASKMTVNERKAHSRHMLSFKKIK